VTYVDLTHDIDSTTPVAPILPSVSVEQVLHLERDRTNVLMCAFPTHSGTHLDAPRHFLADGLTVDDLPLSALIGQASFIDLALDEALRAAITAPMLAAAGGHVRAEDRLFIRTGFCELYRDPRYFEHPYLTEDAVDWLLERRVSLIGLDVLAPEVPHSMREHPFAFPVHHRLLGAGVLIAENVNLPRSLPARFEVMILPLLIRDGDGAPARIVAEVP
jgi:arylformamidase